MNIGPYKLIALETGCFALDGGAMFGVVPKNLWIRKNPADDANRIDLALRTLLLISDEKKILIDTGIGEKFSEKWQKIYKIDHSRQSLLSSLKAYSVSPDQITDVILTHLHFDHCGGTTFRENDSTLLRFPNATYHIQKEQWQWANEPSEKDHASFLPENFAILKDSAKLNLINGSLKLFPGIETLVMYGHTPGMQLLKISDHNQTVLYCSDLIPTASHIAVPWVMAYDNYPLKTIAEKVNILPGAVSENWLLFFEHDLARAAGFVKENEKGYELKQEFSTSEFNNLK